MQQIVVEVVRIELPEGVAVHLQGRLGGLVAEVGQLGGNVIAAAGITAEGDAGRLFAQALQVSGGCIKVVDAVKMCLLLLKMWRFKQVSAL